MLGFNARCRTLMLGFGAEGPKNNLFLVWRSKAAPHQEIIKRILLLGADR